MQKVRMSNGITSSIVGTVFVSINLVNKGRNSHRVL